MSFVEKGNSLSPHQNSWSIWQLGILIVLALTRGLLYLSLFPPWVAPDEPAHFEAVRILGQERRLPFAAYYESNPVNPELSASFVTFRMWELLERPTPAQWLQAGNAATIPFSDYPYPGSLVTANSYPLLPHLVLSPFSNWIRNYDIVTELYLLRLISVLFSVAVIVIAWFITRRVFPHQPQFWLAIPAFIVFLPMYTHIFASVNSDVFAVLLSSILLLVMISFFDSGASIIKIVLVIFLVGLAVLTKRTVVFVVLWVGLTAILYWGNRRRWPAKRVITLCLVITGAVGLVIAWVIVRPDILSNTMVTMFNIHLADAPAFTSFIYQGLTPTAIAKVYVQSGLFAFITFWGNFGGATTNIPWSWAYGLMIFCGLVITGAAIYLYKFFRQTKYTGTFQGYVFIIFLIGVTLSLLNSFIPVLVAGPRWGPAARYFFPVIIPIATLFFLGVWQLFPAKYRQFYLLPLWLAALIAYDALAVTQVIIPFLYG